MAVPASKLSRDEKTEQTKHHIYECAMRLFRERGYSKVTVADIVQASGVSNGSFYHHFKYKENLLQILNNIQDKKYVNFYDEVLCSQDYHEATAIEKLSQFIKFTLHVLVFSEDEELSRALLMHSIVGANDEAKAIHYGPDRGFRQVILEMINEGQHSGIIRQDMQADELFLYLVVFVNGLYLQQLGCDEHFFTEGEVADYIQDFLFRTFSVR